MAKNRPPPLSAEQWSLRQAAADARAQAIALGESLRATPPDATTPEKEQQMAQLFRRHVQLLAEADALANHEKRTQGRAGRIVVLLMMGGFVLIALWRISVAGN